MDWMLLFLILLNVSVVFLFGVLFGLAELLQRYREWKYIFPKKLKVSDEINNDRSGKKCFFSFCKKQKTTDSIKSDMNNKTRLFSRSYVIINGFVSVIALFVVKYFDSTSTNAVDFKDFEINNIIIAGFGGMMVLRSYFFSYKSNGKQIDVGLALLVQVFLDIIERNIKHNAAALRVCNIHEIMKNVDFNSAKDELPLLCIEFVDNFTEEDSKMLKDKIAKIATFDISNVNKSMQLGREIAYYCDEEILRRTIKKLPHILLKENNQSSEQDGYESRKLKLEKQLNSTI